MVQVQEAVGVAVSHGLFFLWQASQTRRFKSLLGRADRREWRLPLPGELEVILNSDRMDRQLLLLDMEEVVTAPQQVEEGAGWLLLAAPV